MKRFTETLKWNDPWFRRLSTEAKILWIYLLDHCDNIGLVDVDPELISLDCGLKIQFKHLFELGDRIQQVSDTKVFLPKFISFQYGRLSQSCPAHKRVIESIARHDLVETDNGYYYPNARVAIPKKTGQDNIRIEEDKSTKTNTLIDQLWQIFPNTSKARTTRIKMAAAWDKTKNKPEDAVIIDAARKWASCHEWTKDGGQFAPGAHRWINDRKWEIDPPQAKTNGPRTTTESFNYQKNGNTTRPLFD